MRFGADDRNPNEFMGERRRARRLLATASGLALVAFAPALALAQAAAPTPSQPTAQGETPEIVVNGIPYHETVLPTRLSSSSVYGLDLNVMDTPRNTTLLSNTQLQTLNIQDPRAFSYLTASSYTDSAFGTPNIPRSRGQYADTFYNGMRSSFTVNGYGAPPNFDSLDTINIVKGPASVVDGPGPGVGGEADFITKRPNMFHMVEQGSASIDTFGNHRWSVDVGGPLIPGDLAARVSYSGDDDDSYFYGHYFRKNAVYAAVRWKPNDKYQLDFNTEVNVEQYTENVGVNRVNQALIDHGLYLQGAPTSGDPYAELIGLGAGGFPVGSPGNPYAPAAPILTGVTLTNEVPFNTKVTIDQTPGTSARSLKYNAQLIQRYDFTNDLSIENNTFFDYINSDNQDNYYFADSTKDSWSIESRTELHDHFELSFGKGMEPIKNEIVAGSSFRYAHVNYISNFSAEPASVYDLTGNPNLWVFDGPTQLNYADAFLYKSAMGRQQYGVPGRDSVNLGNTGISDMYDTALFFQDRVEFTPKLSALFGAREDVIQNTTQDPLGGAACTFCFTSIPGSNPPLPLPQEHHSGYYGLGNANVSVVYKAEPWVSTYATLDFTQSTNPNGGNGGVNSFLKSTDSVLLRSDSYLYEGGFKFNLLNNKLFISTAGFDQKRSVPTGAAGTKFARANIRGFEIELNYQPTRNLFATASYSYIDTTLNKAAGFYNYPADNANNYPGTNYNFVDGAGLFAVFAPGQKFEDPGVPQQIFNFLGNYKFDNGIGFRAGVQVIGPIQTTTSGVIDLAASSFVPQSVINNGGYYKSPVIPWQYTLNAAVFYEISKYTFTLSVYNLTDQLNWQSAVPFYGNDFLVRNDPRTVEFRVQAKF